MGKIYAVVRMALAEGVEEKFRACAAATMAAARQDLAGTVAYEWFLSEDGRECTVIEAYDGPEALGHHGKMVGATIPPIRELAEMDIMFAGDVPAPLLERMRGGPGKVAYFGPRFQGLLDAPASGAVGPDCGSMIFAVARFAILPGREAEFRALAEQCFALVKANEPGTIGYEWFLDEAGGECLTLDVYRDAAALAAHMANAGPVMVKLLETVTSDVQIYGALPEAFRAKFQPGVGARFVAPQLQGMM